MSDLDGMIDSWRRSMSAAVSLQQVDELEDHLRRTIDSLGAAGLSDDEAFTVATMRCGPPARLALEYERADAALAWSNRLRWMVVGAVACALAGIGLTTINTAFGVALAFGSVPLAAMIALRIAFLSVVIFFTIAGWNAWLRRRPDALAVRPPRWPTSGWTLAVMLAALPWLAVGAQGVDAWIALRGLSTEQVGRVWFAGNITALVLPFTAPLILLIVAISLSRQCDAQPARSEG